MHEGILSSMHAKFYAEGQETPKRTAALGMLCAALGYSCSLAAGAYPPQAHTAMPLAALAAPAIYVAYRAIAHCGKTPDLPTMLQHCAVALAVALLPMLFAAQSIGEPALAAINAALFACAGLAALGVLSMRHSPIQALVVMATCALGWIIGSRGLAFAGLGSLALHASTAAAIALLVASVPMFAPENHAASLATEQNAGSGDGPAAQPQTGSTEEGSAEPASPNAVQEVPTLEEATLAVARSHDLSNREFDLLSLIVEGADNKRISEELFISPNTVKTHLRNIYSKLDVHSKEEIIALVEEARSQNPA